MVIFSFLNRWWNSYKVCAPCCHNLQSLEDSFLLQKSLDFDMRSLSSLLDFGIKEAGVEGVQLHAFGLGNIQEESNILACFFYMNNIFSRLSLFSRRTISSAWLGSARISVGWQRLGDGKAEDIIQTDDEQEWSKVVSLQNAHINFRLINLTFRCKDDCRSIFSCMIWMFITIFERILYNTRIFYCNVIESNVFQKSTNVRTAFRL